jgi:hypothetical protein
MSHKMFLATPEGPVEIKPTAADLVQHAADIANYEIVKALEEADALRRHNRLRGWAEQPVTLENLAARLDALIAHIEEKGL